MFLNGSDGAPPSNKMQNQEDHKQDQQNVDERHGDVEGDETDEPCD